MSVDCLRRRSRHRWRSITLASFCWFTVPCRFVCLWSLCDQSFRFRDTINEQPRQTRASRLHPYMEIKSSSCLCDAENFVIMFEERGRTKAEERSHAVELIISDSNSSLGHAAEECELWQSSNYTSTEIYFGFSITEICQRLKSVPHKSTSLFGSDSLVSLILSDGA